MRRLPPLSAVRVFEAAARHENFTSAAGELGMTLSTAYRYFKSLVEAGLIAAHTPSRYMLGPAIIRYDRQMRLLDPLIASATPVMRRPPIASSDVAVPPTR